MIRDRVVMDKPFSVTVDHRDAGTAVIIIDGELDVLSAPVLSKAISDEFANGRVRLVVDAAQLRFCDSQGLWVLVQAARRITGAGGSFRIAAPSAFLLRLLTVTRVGDAFPVDPDVATALDPDTV